MRKYCNLIVIENGRIETYFLDNRQKWLIGRAGSESRPDIELQSKTVSRRQGELRLVGTSWMYRDCCGKNGTILDGKRIRPRQTGSIPHIELEDGDVFIFGSGDSGAINSETVWALYTTKDVDDEWRTVDTSGYDKIRFKCRNFMTEAKNPEKGFYVIKDDGAAIYMGGRTYLSGYMELG